MCVYDFMALITAMVLCARSQDSILSTLLSRVHVVFSTTGFKGGGKPCYNTCESGCTVEMHTASPALLDGIEPKLLVHFNMALTVEQPGHWFF